MATQRRTVQCGDQRRTSRCDQTKSGRLVIVVQIVSWCAVGVLLIMRGVSTLNNDLQPTPVSNATDSSEGVEATHNATSTSQHSTMAKINPSSAILITVGATMLVIGPTLLLARILDSRRVDRDHVKFSKVDPPPNYDDVVDKAPRYSSLFQVTESGELVPVTGTSSTSVPV